MEEFSPLILRKSWKMVWNRIHYSKNPYSIAPDGVAYSIFRQLANGTYHANTKEFSPEAIEYLTSRVEKWQRISFAFEKPNEYLVYGTSFAHGTSYAQGFIRFYNTLPPEYENPYSWSQDVYYNWDVRDINTTTSYIWKFMCDIAYGVFGEDLNLIARTLMCNSIILEEIWLKAYHPDAVERKIKKLGSVDAYMNNTDDSPLYMLHPIEYKV